MSQHKHAINAAQNPNQGCQMVYFQTKNPNLGKFWRVLQWKTLVYMSTWYILRPFWYIYGRLIYFMVIWYIYGRLIYFMVIWYIFPFLVCCSKKNRSPMEDFVL
jgi:hypothetical protein